MIENLFKLIKDQIRAVAVDRFRFRTGRTAGIPTVKKAPVQIDLNLPPAARAPTPF